MGQDAQDEIDPLNIERGLITAPAGCGKTDLIARSLTRHTGGKPLLVLRTPMLELQRFASALIEPLYLRRVTDYVRSTDGQCG